MQKMKNKRQSTFTLIEVLIAIAVSTISIIVGYKCLGMSKLQSAHARYLLEAERLAFETAQALVSKEYSSLKMFGNRTYTLDSSDPENIYYRPLRSAVDQKLVSSDFTDRTPDLSYREGEMSITLTPTSSTRDATTNSTDKVSVACYRIDVSVNWQSHNGNDITSTTATTFKYN